MSNEDYDGSDVVTRDQLADFGKTLAQQVTQEVLAAQQKAAKQEAEERQKRETSAQTRARLEAALDQTLATFGIEDGTTSKAKILKQVALEEVMNDPETATLRNDQAFAAALQTRLAKVCEEDGLAPIPTDTAERTKNIERGGSPAGGQDGARDAGDADQQDEDMPRYGIGDESWANVGEKARLKRDSLIDETCQALGVNRGDDT